MFNDFILYSRAAKKLAEMYTENITYDIDKIVDNFDIKRFRKYKNKTERLRTALKTEIDFKFPMKPKMVDSVVDKLMKKV